MLLHRKTREQLDINIKDSIIIIDEAHNLLETITSIHSAEITSEQLERAHQQLTAYKMKYFEKFSTKNLLRLNQLISIANRILKSIIQNPSKQSSHQSNEQHDDFTSKMIQTHDLFDEINVSHGNLFDILKFCDETHLAKKVSGFALRYAGSEVILNLPSKKPKPSQKTYLQQLSEKKLTKDSKSKPNVNTVMEEPEKPVENVNRLTSASVIRIFLNFLETLLEKATDGRILISKHKTLQSKSFIKYLLLDAHEPFEDLAKECRAIILAGGTMQPTTEFKTQLFQNFRERVEEHFYGHVVSNQAILPLAVSKGPRNSTFLFNYANRGNIEMVITHILIFLFLFIHQNFNNKKN